MRLVWPETQYLTSYAHTLERGWSPDNLRAEAGQESLDEIARDAERFLSGMVDRDAKGPPVTLPDGTTVPRLPPYCLGHIGYSVVRWKQGKGYATRALQLLIPEARSQGLPYVELTTDADNIASRRVIEANGGILFDRFNKPEGYGGAASLRFRIPLR